MTPSSPVEPGGTLDYGTYWYVPASHLNPPLAKRANPQISAIQKIADTVPTWTHQDKFNKKIRVKLPCQNPSLLQKSQLGLLSHMQDLWSTISRPDQTNPLWKVIWTLSWYPEQGSHKTPRMTFRPSQPHSWHNAGHESHSGVYHQTQ